MIIPVVNAQQAGLAPASADMNAYSAAARFACSPPMALAYAQASAQPVTASVLTAITWQAPARDNDATWSAGTPAVFTLQTQGFYEVAAHICVASLAECFIRLTTGAGNPAGPGVISDWWHGSAAAFAGSDIIIGSPGIIPALIYPGDTLQLIVQAAANTSTANVSGWWGDWHHRLVST